MLVAGMIHNFLVWLGIDDVSGPWYAFWSGFGSIVVPPILTVFGVLLISLRHNNCHVKGCLRPGHIDPAVHAPACKHHHSHRDLRGTAPPKLDA